MITKKSLLIDIGGTKTEITNHKQRRIYENKHFHDFEEILASFLKENPMNPDVLAIAAAGPVEGKICHMTNLSWKIDMENIHQSFFPDLSKDKLFLFNDLEAFAWLPQNLLKENKGNYSVISVGTGLGVAFAFYQKKYDDYLILPTEAGHTRMSTNSGNTTWEEILSGQGIVKLYHSLTENHHTIATSQDLYQLAVNDDPMALKAISIFFETLGIFAQNMSLISNPKKGIFLSGGVISAFYQFSGEKALMKSFSQNNKMHHLLKDIPIELIEDSGPIKGLEVFISHI